MLISILQHLIGAVLIFVLFFGIGFILNMLVKTTWFPSLLYLLAVLPAAVLFGDFEVLSGDFIVYGIGGLGGAILSGSVIQTLRRQGYKMF
jgi:hypothetical protein